jgi:serine/threonine-protein kinase
MPQAGEVLSQYRLVRKIGQGGMGSVWEAVHTRIRSKRAAIKVMLPSLAQDASAVARFEREAEAAAAVGHEGIIDVYDLGRCDDGAPYMVMEFLEGESLKEPLKRARPTGGTLDTELTVYVACNVLSALSAAHRAGIVHRDLKPDNIFLVGTGSELPRVKLLDFGIARFTELGGGQDELTLTRTGMVVGTPYYMSPEQAQGRRGVVDHRTDLWSLGVILYLCTTGRFPYEGESGNHLIVLLVTDFEPDKPRVLNPAIPPALEQVILRAMCKDRDQRYASAEEMLADLRPLASETTLGLLALSERRVTQPPEREEPSTAPTQPPSTPVQPPTVAAPDPLDDLPTQATPEAIRLEATTPFESWPEAQPPGGEQAQMTPAPAVMTGAEPARRPTSRLSTPLLVILAMVVLAALAGGVLALIRSNGGDRSVEPAAQPAPEVAPTSEGIEVTTPTKALAPERPTASHLEATEADRGPSTSIVIPEPPPPSPSSPPTKTQRPNRRGPLTKQPPSEPRPPSGYGVRLPDAPDPPSYGTKI